MTEPSPTQERDYTPEEARNLIHEKQGQFGRVKYDNGVYYVTNEEGFYVRGNSFRAAFASASKAAEGKEGGSGK